MKSCIYCLESKDETAFNREHVLPQAFGTFEKNLVLDCVCTACNQFFGNDIDMKLARDTIEALDRVTHGLKDPRSFKGLGKRSTMKSRIETGELTGLHAQPVGTPAGLRMNILPQVGFAKSASDPYEWFLLDDLPTKEEMKRRGHGVGSLVQIQGADLSDAIEKLREKGFAISSISVHTYGLDVADTVASVKAKGIDVTDVVHVPPPSGSVGAETIATVSNQEFRAVTKIALNYLAAVAGADYARMYQFNDARRYVRYDQTPAEIVVLDVATNNWEITDSQGGPLRGHYICIERVRDHVYAQLSLLGRLRYVLRLGGHFSLNWALAAGHLFDIDRRTVERIPVLPLAPPRGFSFKA